MPRNLPSRLSKEDSTVAVLTKQYSVRALDFSASGCRLETSTPIQAGTVGALRLEFGGRQYTDDVLIVRCQADGPASQIGAQFLWTTPPHDCSLRMATRELVMSGFLNSDQESE